MGPPLRANQTIARRAGEDTRPYGGKQNRSVGSEKAGAELEPNRLKFLLTQGPVARIEYWNATQILRAGNEAQLFRRASPVMGSGVQRLGAPERCASEQTPAAFWLLCRRGQSNPPRRADPCSTAGAAKSS